MSSTNRSVKETVGLETIKGKLLRALANGAQGSNDTALLALTGVVTSGETVTVGSTTFELLDIATDSTRATGDGAASEMANTTDPLTFDAGATLAAMLVAGVNGAPSSVLRVETEFMLVTNIDGTNVTVSRGYAGSTAASHADAEVIYTSALASGVTTLETQGNVPVPLGGTLTAAAADDLIKAAFDSWQATVGATVTTTLEATTSIRFSHPYGMSLPVNAEAMANATVTNFADGSDDAAVSKSEVLHLVDGAETSFTLFCPSTPVAAIAVQIDDSGGVAIYDNTTAISGNAVTVTEGATAWEDDTDYVWVTIFY